MKFSKMYLGLSAVLVIYALIVAPTAAWAKSPVNKNWRGLAIKGYDPVAYFTSGKPRLGSRRFEFRWAGSTWRFASEGNMGAFAKSPDVYAPRYGGYGALGVARGHASQGSPHLWANHEGRLYFFYSPANRIGWKTDPRSFIGRADAIWPGMQKALPR